MVGLVYFFLINFFLHFNWLFFFRCPEDAKVKQKMLYSSSYEALKRALVGIYKYVQACEFEEASEKAISEAFK